MWCQIGRNIVACRHFLAVLCVVRRIESLTLRRYEWRIRLRNCNLVHNQGESSVARRRFSGGTKSESSGAVSSLCGVYSQRVVML